MKRGVTPNEEAPRSLDKDLGKAARHSRIDRKNNWLNICLYSRPTCCAQNDNGDSTGCEVLLVLQIGVGGYEHRKTSQLGGLEKFAVLQRRPTKLIRGRDLMREQELAQRRRSSLIEQNLHYAVVKALRAACSSTARACTRLTPGNHSTN